MAAEANLLPGTGRYFEPGGWRSLRSHTENAVRPFREMARA